MIQVPMRTTRRGQEINLINSLYLPSLPCGSRNVSLHARNRATGHGRACLPPVRELSSFKGVVSNRRSFLMKWSLIWRSLSQGHGESGKDFFPNLVHVNVPFGCIGRRGSSCASHPTWAEDRTEKSGIGSAPCLPLRRQTTEHGSPWRVLNPLLLGNGWPPRGARPASRVRRRCRRPRRPAPAMARWG